MITDLYSNSLSVLKRQVSVLGLTCAGLSISMAIAMSILATRHDRIVVVPPGLSGPVNIDWGQADAEYMKTFGIFYSTLLGTITPRNAQYVADRLTAMTSAAAYPEIRLSILAMAKDPAFASSGSSSNFMSNQVVYEAETGKTFVSGDNQIYSGFGVPRLLQVVYEMDIRIIEGRPIVHSVINYPGLEPHTIEWKIAHPGWNKIDTHK